MEQRRKTLTEEGLTPLQSAFVAMYMVTRSAREAYLFVHPDAKNPAASAYQMLKHPAVRKRIIQYTSMKEVYHMKEAKIIEEELEKIAFFRITDVLAWDNNSVTVNPSSMLSDDAIAGIQDVDITETEYNGVKALKIKIKSAEKLRAIEMLARIRGMFKEDQKQIPEEVAPDLSVLTDEELATYEQIQEKLMAGETEV